MACHQFFQGFTGGSDNPGSLSYTSPSCLRAFASGASLFHTSVSPMRHIQLFSVLPGRFILPLLSSRMMSCGVTCHVSHASTDMRLAKVYRLHWMCILKKPSIPLVTKVRWSKPFAA